MNKELIEQKLAEIEKTINSSVSEYRKLEESLKQLELQINQLLGQKAAYSEMQQSLK